MRLSSAMPCWSLVATKASPANETLGVGRPPARQVNLGEFGNTIGAKLPKLCSLTY